MRIALDITNMAAAAADSMYNMYNMYSTYGAETGDIYDIYISLGSDCSVTHQLRKYNLQKFGSFPFDWMKITNIYNLIAILDTNFEHFLDFTKYDIKTQSPLFKHSNILKKTYLAQGDHTHDTELSLKKMTHKDYKFTLPHEYIGENIDIDEFIAKYDRRIKKFIDIGKNDKIRKKYVRLCNGKEIKLEQEKDNIALLNATLIKMNYTNFEIITINMDDYVYNQGDAYTWHRDYIPWDNLLGN